MFSWDTSVVPVLDLLVDVLGDGLARTLFATHGVRLVHGIRKDDVPRFQVHDLDAGRFVGLLRTEEQHLGPPGAISIRHAAQLVIRLITVDHHHHRYLLLLQSGSDIGFEPVGYGSQVNARSTGQSLLGDDWRLIVILRWGEIGRFRLLGESRCGTEQTYEYRGNDFVGEHRSPPSRWSFTD